MKECPILFNAPMVRAMLNGSKTQTRRVVKLPHQNPLGTWEPTSIGGPNGGRLADGGTVPEQGAIWHTRTGDCLSSPYGQPGDQLWVRENFQPFLNDDCDGDMRLANWKTGENYHCSYPATDGVHEFMDADDKLRSTVKPSIHMPRWASRILLEIVSVRVERLTDISEADAKAEGVEAMHYTFEGVQPNWRDYQAPVGSNWEWTDSPRKSFLSLWRLLEGPCIELTNPWIWAIEFKRVTA